MRVDLVLQDGMYKYHTTLVWKAIWEYICRMAYEGVPPQQKLMVFPGHLHDEFVDYDMSTELGHTERYNSKNPKNYEEITLEYMWKQYSQKHGTKNPIVVPEFEELHVPRALFDCLGVHAWFQYSFPNCKVTYWHE